jgi:hypothetical protein
MSCGGPSAHNVVPDFDGLQIVTVEKTLQVVPVTGGKGRRRTFENDEFADALTQALSKSRLFARVSKDRGGDYLLRAHIVTQGVCCEGLGNVHAVFVVRYTLEKASSSETFKKEIVTGCRVTSSNFIGQVRVNDTFRCAVHSNLNRLVRELARNGPNF